MRRLATLVRVLLCLAVGSGGAALAAPAAEAPVPERLTACVACHGAGTSTTEGVPSLGAQPADYVVTQLFQFREKQREAAPMNDIAAGFSDDDLKAYADAIATCLRPLGPARLRTTR